MRRLPAFPRAAALLLPLGSAVPASLLLTTPAQAAPLNITVDTLADSSNPADGVTSLREAITTANPTASTIDFAAGLKGTINLGSSLPDITGNVTIQGPGAKLIAIDGGGTYRILKVTSTVSISGLTFQNGYDSTPSAPDFGYGGGGAIYVLDGDLTINRCIFRNNRADNEGGAIENYGTSTIRNSAFTGNSAPFGGVLCTWGNGVHAGVLNLHNVTLAGNSGFQGGAIINAGVLNIQTSTLTKNTASSGGGIADLNPITSIHNSIVSQNTAGSGAEIQNTSTPSGTYNFIGGDPVLDPAGLQDNGGLIPTVALLAGSPCINAGDPAYTGETYDPRGAPLVRVKGGRLDIGAFEFQNRPPVASDFFLLLKGTASGTAPLKVSDFENNNLTYSIVDQPDHGTLGPINGNSVVYTPDGSYAGNDSFTFKANDGEHDSNIATVTIKTNTAPTLESLTISQLDNTPINSGSSVEAEVPLKLSLTVKDDEGAGYIRQAFLVFNKTLAHNGGASLDYDPGTNKISMRNAQGQIVAGQTVGTATTYSNGLITLDFGQSSVVKNEAAKTLTVTWVVTPTSNFTGIKGLWAQARDTYALVDGFDKFAELTLLPPTPYVSKVVAQDAVTVIKPGATSQSLILPVANPDGVALTYSIVDGPANGTLNPLNGNRVVYTPGVGFDAVGRDTFTFKANDGYGDSNIATYTIKYNSAPQLGALVVEKIHTPTTGTTSEVNEQLRLSLTVSDEDGANNVRMIYLIFNKAQSHAGGASLEYDPGTNRVAMRDAQGQLVTGQVAGTPGTQGNGLVFINFSQARVEKDPVNKTITVSWGVKPAAGFTGLKGIWAQVRDISGATDGFRKLGEWTILPQTPSFKTKSAAPSTNTF